MISSRQPIRSLNFSAPNSVVPLISSWALLFHTFVPWDRPEIFTSSAKVDGKVSISIPRTKFVPSSGTAKDATLESISSGVTPMTLGS